MENVIKIVPKNLVGRPKLSETEKKRRKLVRSFDPLKRITKQQRAVLDALVRGESLEDAALSAGANLDILRATAYSPEMRAALAELRAQLHQRIRDAAMHHLACLAGCSADPNIPASKDEKIRLSALKTIVAAIRDTSCDLQGRNGNDEAETTGDEAKAADASPKLVIVIDGGERKTGDSGEAIDVTPELSVSEARTVVRDETV